MFSHPKLYHLKGRTERGCGDFLGDFNSLSAVVFFQ